MKERLITLLGGALAFYIVIVLLFPQQAPIQKKISAPTTEDRGDYGLAGLKKWLDQSGVPTLSLRQRYHVLYDNPELTSQGNLLIMSLPHRVHARQWEREQLITWLSQGNHLLVLAALSDWPEWAQQNARNSVESMLGLLGFSIYLPESEKEGHRQEDAQDNIKAANEQENKKRGFKVKVEPKSHSRSLIKAGPHPVTQNINTIEATWLESEGLNWHLSGMRSKRSALIVLQDQQDQNSALWQVRVGEAGNAWISRHAELFGNLSLARVDNARLIENIIRYSLHTDGTVIFDDMHQGLTNLYDPEAFFNDSRLHHTLWFLLVLWLIYLLGHSNRFHPVLNKLRPQQLIDHVRAFGGLFARRIKSDAVAQRMFIHFFNELRSYYGLPRNGQPLWEKLRSNSHIHPQPLDQAQTYYHRAQNSRPVNLTKLSNCINSIRNQLL